MTRLLITDNKKGNETQENFLLEKNLESKDPVSLFDKWFSLAKNDPKTDGAHLMCLATATKSGTPSARMMTLKDYSNEGFVFFTSYKSRKGEELENNPKAALIFYWGQFSRSVSMLDAEQSVAYCHWYCFISGLNEMKECRPLKHFSLQVRIEGTVEHVTCCKSDDEFRKGSYESQIGALLCEQSTPIQDRFVLDCRANKMRKQYPEGKVPRPPSWGGYIVRPHTIEFWQGHKDSLHDRIRFRRPKAKEPDGVLTHEAENGWVYERLCPP